ncbi:NitT/TauT family transport system substrate-binding protein [Marvinbryantia formatexigens]|nr:NitT/TauT family transport system substrate-binding protein [Marvinbryantia formatexigens]
MKKWKRVTGMILAALLAAAALTACGNGGNAGQTAADSETAGNSAAADSEAAGNNAAAVDSEAAGDDAASGQQVVRLGYLPITHALALLAEKELLDAEDGAVVIELEKFSSWSDLTDALNAGRIDGASVLIELAMSAAGQGIDLKAAALGHKDGNVIVVSDGITSAAGLQGKTFAIPHTQSSHNILLNDMLTENGLSISDVKVVQLAPSEMPSALAGGSIDGYCVAEPFGAQAVAQGFGHVLYHSEELWDDSLCCALVLNGSFIENNPETTDFLLEKYNEAGKSLDKEKAQQIAEQYLGQNADVLEQSLEWIRFDDLAITKEAYQTLEDKVVAYGINENPPAYEDFVYQTQE